jgi:hypothetical protein
MTGKKVAVKNLTATGYTGHGSSLLSLRAFGTQEFHKNLVGISHKSVQFHKKNVGTRIFNHNPNRP